MLEDIYTFEDALLVGCILMTLQNNCDRVKMACLAQLVNVIAPIMTENGGKAWVQTIFYPFLYASTYGNGIALQTVVESGTYQTKERKDVSCLVTSAIHHAEKREVIVFAVNRSIESDMEFEINLEEFGEYQLSEHIELYSEDLKAVNGRDHARVEPRSVPVGKGSVVTLKKHSWNMIRIRY